MPTQQITCDSKVMPSRDYFKRSDIEVMAFNLLIPLLSIVSFSLCYLAKLSLVPSLLVFLFNIVVTTHIVTLTHELMHEPSSSTHWNYLLRINLHVYSPFTVGFDEYKRLHTLHHMHENTSMDPDLFMVKGNRFRSFLLLSFAPEYWFFYVLRHHETKDHFWLFWFVRMSILAMFISVVGPVSYFVLFFVPTKISYGVGFLLFSHESHTNEVGERCSAFNLLTQSKALSKVLELVLGPYAFNIAFRHATHHLYPWVSSRKLDFLWQDSATLLDGEQPSQRYLFGAESY